MLFIEDCSGFEQVCAPLNHSERVTGYYKPTPINRIHNYFGYALLLRFFYLTLRFCSFSNEKISFIPYIFSGYHGHE
jgi:hypothetical protein